MLLWCEHYILMYQTCSLSLIHLLTHSLTHSLSHTLSLTHTLSLSRRRTPR